MQQQLQNTQKKQPTKKVEDQLVVTFDEHILTYYHGRQICQCAVTVYGNLVIATEINQNPGTSITNSAEYAAAAACQRFGIEPRNLIWIEHYVTDTKARRLMKKREMAHNARQHSLDFVRFHTDADGKIDTNATPVWNRIHETQLVETILRQ
jgi:hypothetical protein